MMNINIHHKRIYYILSLYLCCPKQYKMITNHGGEYPYKMSELYDKLGLATANYSRWVRMNLLEMFYENSDYIEFVDNNKGVGKPAREFLLKNRTAEELALLSKTPQGKTLRKWLLDLKDAVETHEYLTHDQVLFLIDLIKVFSFVTNQKAAETAHLNTFKEYNKDIFSDSEFLYAKFHILRNQDLNITQEQIKERIQRFYDEEDRLIDKKTKRDILAVLNKYELIGHGAFDFLKSIGKPSETAIRVMDIVLKMSERIEPVMRNKNENDLFDSKIPLNGTIMRSLRERSNSPKLLN
jgi:phage anti-repressor protein